MLPGTYNLQLYKGDDWRRKFTIQSGPDLENLTPIDWTGSTVRAQIRPTVAASSVMATIACTFTATPADGIINVHLTNEEARNLIPGTAVWDLEVTRSGGDVETYLKGSVAIDDDVTEDVV